MVPSSMNVWKHKTSLLAGWFGLDQFDKSNDPRLISESSNLDLLETVVVLGVFRGFRVVLRCLVFLVCLGLSPGLLVV